MYIGRIVAVGLNPDNRGMALYRVSSRSFPNREAVIGDGKVSVVPRAGFEADLGKNPYIAYNCLRPAGEFIAVSNGSHTDPIAEKLASGVPPRDALTMSLLALDFEHDSLDTPRVAGVVNADAGEAWLGIVRRDALLVRKMTLRPGQLFYISTYEHCYPCECFTDEKFSAKTAAAGCDHIISGGVFEQFTNPVTAACAMFGASGIEFAVRNA